MNKENIVIYDLGDIHIIDRYHDGTLSNKVPTELKYLISDEEYSNIIVSINMVLQDIINNYKSNNIDNLLIPFFGTFAGSILDWTLFNIFIDYPFGVFTMFGGIFGFTLYMIYDKDINLDPLITTLDDINKSFEERGLSFRYNSNIGIYVKINN